MDPDNGGAHCPDCGGAEESWPGGGPFCPACLQARRGRYGQRELPPDAVRALLQCYRELHAWANRRRAELAVQEQTAPTKESSAQP